MGSTGTVVARLTGADGAVLAATNPFRIVEPPEPEPADAQGPAKVAVPNVYEIMRAQWSEHGFGERSVATVSESRDDCSIFINVDNVHLTRLVESVSYQQTGLTRMRTAFVVQAAFYAFLLHRGRETSMRSIDTEVLEAYESDELDRVAQTIVSSIASVERIDAGALLDSE